MGGFYQIHDSVIIFTTCCFVGIWTSTGTLMVWVVPSQVWTYHFPTVTTILCFEYHISCMVNGVSVVWGANDRRIPIVSEFEVFWNFAQSQFWVFFNGFCFLGGPHPFFDDTLIATTINKFGIIGVKGQISTFTTRNGIPIFPINAIIMGSTGNGNGRIVLLSAINVVGNQIIRNYSVKL